MKTYVHVHYSKKSHKTGCFKRLLANLKLNGNMFTTLKKSLVYYRIALTEGDFIPRW